MTSEDFRNLRHSLGLSQVALAEIMGMTPQAISRIERGDRDPTKQQAAFIRYIEQHPVNEK